MDLLEQATVTISVDLAAAVLLGVGSVTVPVSRVVHPF